jgi:hypothetical protein
LKKGRSLKIEKKRVSDRGVKVSNSNIKAKEKEMIVNNRWKTKKTKMRLKMRSFKHHRP